MKYGISIAIILLLSLFASIGLSSPGLPNNQNTKTMPSAEMKLIKSAIQAYQAKNYKNAMFLLKKAESNDTEGFSQSLIGDLYGRGEGVKQDFHTALYWYSVALEKMHGANASGSILLILTNDLGICYEHLHDYVLAFQYYEQAAKMGYPIAQHNLACFYAAGHGTIQDYKKAYAWASVAAAVGVNKQHKYSLNQFISSLKQKLILQGYTNNPSRPDDELQQAQALAKQYYKLYVLHQSTSSEQPKTPGN